MNYWKTAMIRLIKIELKKIVNYKTFWALVGMYLVSLSFTLGMSQFIINKIVDSARESAPIPLPRISLFYFPKIFENLSYVAGYFNIFLAIIVIFFICNEFNYKTLRQNIITGLSRKEFLISKLSFILILSLAATLFLFLISLILGFIHTSSPDINDIFTYKLQFLAGYFVESVTYLVFAFFISFILKRAGVAIITLLFYTMMEQIIVWWKVSHEFVMYMPMKAFGRLVHFPSLPIPTIDGNEFRFQDYVSIYDTGIALVYASILTYLIYLLLRKRDL